MLFSTAFLTTRFLDFNGSKILLPALWHCLENPVLSPHSETTTYTGSLSLNESSSSWCSLSTKLLMPTIFLNCFKFTLHRGIFDQVPCFSPLNPLKSRHSWGDRSFSSAAPRIWNSLPLNLRSCLCTTKFKSLLKLILCHRFSWTNFVVSVFLCFCVVFGFTAPWTPSRVDMCALQVLLLLFIIIISS